MSIVTREPQTSTQEFPRTVPCFWCNGGRRAVYGRSGESVEIVDCEECGGTGREANAESRPRCAHCRADLGEFGVFGYRIGAKDYCRDCYQNDPMGIGQMSDTCNACLDAGQPHPIECECDDCKQAFQDSMWNWLTPEIVAVCEQANRTGDIPLSMQ